MPYTSANQASVPILGQATLCYRWDNQAAMDWLLGLRERLGDPRPFWSGVGAVMRGSFRQNFEQGGRPAWAALKPRTVRSKALFLKSKPSPPYKNGKIPQRLLQNGAFSSQTKLIRTGKLRDSWVQKGAEGHVEAVSATGENFFVGSQLTLTRRLGPSQPLKPYHLATKKAKARKAAGRSAWVRIPLARFHEEGTKLMVARPNAQAQPEDLQQITKLGTRWVLGELP